MSMRITVLCSLVAVATAMLLVGARTTATIGAQPGTPPPLEAIHVAGDVYTLQTPTAQGNLAALVGPDGVLLVDAQFSAESQPILDALAEVTDESVRFLINTHIHPDHIGANAELANQGVLIFAHDLVREQMLDRIRIPRRGGLFFDQPPPEARPVVTYDKEVTFHVNGEAVRSFLVPPSHTGGDSFVYFPSADVLAAGDVFRTNMYPIIDVHNGGTFGGLIEATELAIEMSGPNTKIVPGHGFGFTDKAGLEEVMGMLVDIRDRVQTLIDGGASLDEVLAARPTAHLDERWGGVPSWTAADLLPIVYEEYSD